MAILGGLGSGKTLSLTYLGLRNLLKGKAIWSNYHLNFEHTYIETLDEIDDMREGTFLGDELWAWLDARASSSKRNRFISNILLKSRKRGYDILYTAQDFDQMDKRIRRITDFVAFPQMSRNEDWCVLTIAERRTQRILKQLKFRTAFVFRMYDTAEEITELDKKGKVEK